MAIHVSYTDARARLAELLDAAVEDREPVVIRRRGRPDAILMAADEVAGLVETAHLLRSPRNAARLVAALEEALRGKGKLLTIEELRSEVGIDETDA